jgi:sugar phosphate isomerase/epimerase
MAPARAAILYAPPSYNGNSMSDRFRIAAITDEFTPDFESALSSMASVGMTGAELRMLWGKNTVDLSDEELDRAIALARQYGMEIISIASPLLKCVLPDAPPVDERFQQDSFAARHTFADQPKLAARAFEIAERTGARIIRVFSYWRTVDPDACFERIVEALRGLAGQAEAHGVTIALENEHACNIGTGAETARALKALDHPNLKIVWDPANTLVAGEDPMVGYAALPVARIAHVHAKDCTVENHKAVWLELGTGAIPWPAQIDALARGGYQGWISLETHWPGPGGNKQEGSAICGRNLKKLVA